MSVNQIVSILNNIANTTNKPYVSIKEVERQYKRAITYNSLMLALKETGFKYTTVVVSGNGWKDEFKEKYAKEAKKNLPLIEFGPHGFKETETSGVEHCVYLRSKP